MKISYIPQDAEFLTGKLDDYIAQNDLDATLVKTLLRKLDFDRVQFEKNMEDYEPLNFIDVFSRMQIEELILKFNPTLLMVEHDKTFVEKIATQKVNFI